ncbi:MAG: hypothetical protein BIFFINMI_03961 [Phycisphaerae bacterium]|nr:hypothetical protein [Phycisphaerae bacterium]
MMLADMSAMTVGIACLAAGMVLAWGLTRITRRGRGGRTQVFIAIEQMRSVGELVVFRILAKEIVTHSDHWAGDFGQRFLSWLWSDRKLAMVFEFDIDFRYDLRSSAFQIIDLGQGRYQLKMPPCRYEVGIKRSSVYDFQAGKLRLLPDLLNLFGQAGKDDINELMEEAQKNIAQTARELVESKRGDIEQSARQTMEALAKGFGVASVAIDFSESQFVQGTAAA